MTPESQILASFFVKAGTPDRIVNGVPEHGRSTVSTIAGIIGMSVAQVRRWAVGGSIPERVQTKGGHYRFRNTPALKRWIAETSRAKLERRSIGK